MFVNFFIKTIHVLHFGTELKSLDVETAGNYELRFCRSNAHSVLNTYLVPNETYFTPSWPKHQSWPQRNLPLQTPQNPARQRPATSGGRSQDWRQTAPANSGGMARGSGGASPCDLDREFAPQIAQLLATPPLQPAQVPPLRFHSGPFLIPLPGLRSEPGCLRNS
jgi:hypothetical protein